MVIGKFDSDGALKATITHVGDSRIYWLPEGASQWQRLTQDHNLLNELIDEQVRAKGQQVDFVDYNREGMAGSLYSIMEYLALTTEQQMISSEPLCSSVRTIDVQSDDCMLICTDGIHDLVPSNNWQTVDAKTELQVWLNTLKDQVYDSEGNAYDNGKAIMVRFD